MNKPSRTLIDVVWRLHMECCNVVEIAEYLQTRTDVVHWLLEYARGELGLVKLHT